MSSMTKHSGTKLVPLEVRQEEQSLETVEVSQTEQSELPISELDIEVQCPRCNDIMELCSSFDKLMYSCESCNFLLRCV
jgi:antirestriction protein